MKKTFTLFSLLLVSLVLNAQNVNIPDAIFKNALLKYHNIDTNNDKEIQITEAENYTGGFNITSLGIKSVSGIEAFKNITFLACQVNLIPSMDLSQNKKLTYISCYNNRLVSLTLPQTTSLTSLEASTNLITTLDLSFVPNLRTLRVDLNYLTALDISQNHLLETLDCNNNQLIALNSSPNSALKMLSCFTNQLPALNVAHFPALQFLNCGVNNLTALDLTANTNLYSLSCTQNQLTNLNVDTNVLLEYLDFRNNFIEAITVTQLPMLTTLACSQNKMKALDVSQNTKLTLLVCEDNSLTKLNMKNTNNHNVTYYDSRNNPDLTCIMVDNADFSTANWLNKDNTANFSEDCLYMNVTQETAAKLKLFPNPVKQKFTVQLNGEITAIEIYAQSGQLVKKGNSKTVDISSLPKGIYHVKVKTPTGTHSKNIIKE
ncbi:T9SS type A sorting domain-containing protein [Kaistella palustris]|uniref:T9SS type A sorting domain-containing protein n=1 Tax=Kaistella palustris TaxID=493376 RepID=UPI000406F7FA|nr:T9SS type A sorting domain-containing protein [Kaistella palustris]